MEVTEIEAPKYSNLCYMLDKWIEYLAHDRHFTPEMHAMQRRVILSLLLFISILFSCKAPTRYEVKKYFIITHELSMTGAPIVLSYALKALKNDGYRIFVMSPADGPLRNEFMQYTDVMIIDAMLYKKDYWLEIAAKYDLAFVNTIVPYECIQMLEKINIPVIWWLHDAKIGYEKAMQYVLPQTVGENIFIYSVSQYALEVLNDFRPQYHSKVLQYGLPDFGESLPAANSQISSINPGKKLMFVTIGTIEERKGQDILCDAISMLKQEELDQSIFCLYR